MKISKFSTFNFQLSTSNGQSLVELLVAIAFAAILLPAILTGFISSRDGKAQQNQRLLAVPLLKEAQEATRAVRDKGWSGFAVNGTYHPTIISEAWSLAPSLETVKGYTRKIIVSDVYRDNDGAIVTTGGSIDPSTKKVVTTVSWDSPHASLVSSTMYLTRHLNNAAQTQTTQTDFNAGTKTGVTVTNSEGGEVGLGVVGGIGGDWCTPNLTINALNLPGQGIATDISATQGHAYVTSGGNSSGDSMDSVTISNPPYPQSPVASNGSSYNYRKTYGVFATGNYIYLTSDHPNLTVDIVNASTLNHAGYFNITGGGAGNSVAISGNTGFVTAGSTLYSFNVTSINGSTSQTQLGSTPLAGTGKKIVTVGNYAYVATSNTTSQMQIVNISTPSNLQVVGSFNTGSGAGGIDVSVNFSGTLAFLVTNYISGKKDFFVIDVSDKTQPKVVGSYSTNGMDPKGVVVVPGNKAIVVGNGGEQYQVLDLSNLTIPNRCGGITNPNGATNVNAVASVLESDGDAFSYILTNNASKEFQIIAGGQFASTGTFESSTIDAVQTVTFNRFNVNALKPPQTTLNYQVSASDANPATNNCAGASFSFVGPDLTSNTYFATSSAIPLGTSGGYKNPSRCFRYKAFFSTTDITQSPVLYDFSVNYSP